jgi:hypothetical protein
LSEEPLSVEQSHDEDDDDLLLQEEMESDSDEEQGQNIASSKRTSVFKRNEKGNFCPIPSFV